MQPTQIIHNHFYLGNLAQSTSIIIETKTPNSLKISFEPKVQKPLLKGFYAKVMDYLEEENKFNNNLNQNHGSI